MASYDIIAKVRADMSQFIAGLKSGELATTEFATKVGGMGNAVAVGTAAAVAVAGVALYKLGEAFEKSYKQIRVGTGQTGEQLEALRTNFRNVFAQTPASMGDVSTAITDLNVKLGLTGKPLEEASLQFIKLSRITGTDLKGNIEAVTMVFKNFGVGAADQKDKLDLLYRASQNSGVSVADLAGRMASSGIVLRQLGFDFDSSAALMGTFAKAGIDAGDVMPGLTFALKTAGKQGKDTTELFRNTFEAIRTAPSITEATAQALDVFGGRAGPKLAAAIYEGKLSYEAFAETIKSGTDTISKSASDVGTFGGKLTTLGHQAQLALEPLATVVFQALNDAMKVVMPTFTSIFGVVKNMVEAFIALPGPIKAIIPVFAAAVLAMKGLMVLKTIALTMQASMAGAVASMSASVGAFVTNFIASMTGLEGAAATAGAVVETAFAPVMITLALAFVAFTVFTQASRDSENAQKEFKSTLDETTGALTEQSKALTINKLQHQGTIDKMNDAGISIDRVTKFIEEHNAERIKQGDLEHMVRKEIDASSTSTEYGTKVRDKYVKKLREMGGANNELLADLMANNALSMDTITTLYDEADAYEKKQKELDAVSTATNRANGMTQDAAEAATRAANANKIQADSIQKVIDAQHAATDPVFAAIKAQLDAKKAQDDYNQAIAEGKSGHDEQLRLTVASYEASQAYADALNKLDIAQLKGDSTSEKVLSAIVKMRSYGFEPTAEQVRMLTDAIETNQLKLIALKDPTQAMTDILKEMEQGGVAPTKRAIDDYIANLIRLENKLAPNDPMRVNLDATIAALKDFGNQHPSTTVHVGVEDEDFSKWLADHKIIMGLAYQPGAYKYPGQATGGLVSANTSYMVGERGPEMFVPQVPGSIISADRVASMAVASTGGTTTYVTNVNATVNLPAGANGREVVDAITKYERHNGKVFVRA